MEGDILFPSTTETTMKITTSVFGILTITAALATQVHAQTWLTNGLVAYYPFNGNANDASGNGNDATNITAILSADRFGNPNSAYSFDNVNKMIWVPKSSTLDIYASSGFSVSAWIKSPHGIADSIVWWFNPQFYSGLGPHLTLGETPGMILWAPGYLGNPLPDVYIRTSGGLVPTNTWTQVAGTFDKSNGLLNVYLNGVLVQSLTNTNVAFTSSTACDLLIGGRLYNTPLDYLLDDIRIYNRALSPTELFELYESESGPRAKFVKAFTIDYSNLTLGSNYQLQASADMKTWTNYGAPFTATSVNYTNSNYQRINDWGKLFFRLQVAP